MYSLKTVKLYVNFVGILHSIVCWLVTRICLTAVLQASVREEKKLMVENAKLKNDIEELKKQLLEKEKRRGGMLTFCSRQGFHHRLNVCLQKDLDVVILYI